MSRAASVPAGVPEGTDINQLRGKVVAPG